jgi:protein SCO1/2
VKSLKTFEWTPGQKFEIVTLSINPNEKSELAAKKKVAYLESYGRKEATSGWHFLTGDEVQIRKLAEQVGFGYRYEPKDNQYAHSAAIFALTPDGKISRYLYGIEFKNTDLRLTLLEASNGKIGTIVDRILLFCYRYDPQTRKYSIYLTKVMQTGCGLTLLVFGGYLSLFWRRERKGA